MDDEHGTPIRLDFPFEVQPSGGGMCVFLEEEVHDAFLVMLGYAPGLKDPDRQEAAALVTITGVVQAVYGYPNEEAFWKDPRGDLGHGFHEVVGSRWADRVNEYNRRSFGADAFYDLESLRHFFVGSKDSSAQFLAKDLVVDVFVGKPFSDVRAEALKRLDRWGRDSRR
jgi:hypothetical protein